MKKTFSVSIGEADSDNALTPYLEGPAMSSLIWNWEQLIRNKLKYEELSEAERAVWEKVSVGWYTLKRESGVTGEG